METAAFSNLIDFICLQGQKWEFIKGKLWMNIKKVIRGEPLEIKSNLATIGIKGTTLTVYAAPSATTVKVIEGIVTVTPGAGGSAVSLSVGQSVVTTTAVSGLEQDIRIKGNTRISACNARKSLLPYPYDCLLENFFCSAGDSCTIIADVTEVWRLKSRTPAVMLLKETRINITRFFNFLISRGMAPFLTGLVFLLIDWLILSGIDRAVTAATYRPPAPGEPLAYYHSFQSDQKILVFVLNLIPFLWIYGAILRAFSQAAAGESFSFRAFISGGFKVYWRCLLFGLGTVLFLVPFVFMWVITRVFVSEPAALLIAVNILFLLPALALAVPFHAFATIPGAADRKFLRHIPACLIWSVILGAVLQVPVAGPYIFPALFLLYLSAVIFSREELKKPDK